MGFRYTVLAATLLIVLGGCAKSGSDDMKDQVDDIKDKVKVGADNVWSGQVKAIDKAKDVEKTLMGAAQEQMKAINKQSQ